MPDIYWKKIGNDLRQNAFRVLLAVASVAVATFSLTTVSTSFWVLKREMSADFLRTRPASAIFWFEQKPGSDIVRTLRQMPSVEAAELRKIVEGRIEVAPDVWQTLFLFVVHDFDSLAVNRFFPQSGAKTAAPGEVLIERSCAAVTRTAEGARLRVSVEGQKTTDLRWVGTVHDPAQAPGWMHGEVFGLIAPATLEILGLPLRENAVKIILKNIADRDDAQKQVLALRKSLENQGFSILRADVPPPATHPHDRQLKAILSILLVFSVVVLLLSGVVIANLMNGFLSRQTRQIGMMKAIGGSAGQIRNIYARFIAVLVAVAVPLGWLAAIPAFGFFTGFVSGQLNFDLHDGAAPLGLTFFQILFCAAVPFVFGLLPVLKACRKTVLDAFADANFSEHPKKTAANGFSNIIPRPLLLTLRNTFRKRTRFWLTMASLALGGAAFMASFNVRAAWQRTIAEIEAKQRYDVDVKLFDPVPVSVMDNLFAAVPAVKNFEAWANMKGFVRYADGTESLRFEVSGMPDRPQFYQPNLQEGRTLNPESGENELVATRSLIFLEPRLKVGDTLTLMLGSRPTTWRLVGITFEADAEPTFYALKKTLDRAAGIPKTSAAYFRINTADNSPAAQSATLKSLESRLKNISAALRLTKEAHVLEQNFKDHFTIIVNMLLAIAFFLALVGFMGLSSTMSMNVLERSREYGIMQAIGARGGQIAALILAEGLVISLLSWAAAVLVSLPISFGMDNAIGKVGLLKPLDFVVSWQAVFGWLAAVLFFAFLTGLFPVWQARRYAIREVLGME
jgi:putative ABC transport system permease protein